MSLNDPVPLTTVRDENEAEVLCGFLRSSGIECDWTVTTRGMAGVFGDAGPREISVGRADLEEAQRLLAAQEG
jgi:Putative prokaryotic signal transducing protein